MKKIGNFQTEDQGRLSEQLDRFQDAVDLETKSIRSSFTPLLTQKLFNAATPTGATLLPGQIALCDTNAGNVTVTLAPSPGLTPGFLAVVKRFTAASVTVWPSGQSAPNVPRAINATVNRGYGAGVVGAFWIYFDGLNWWA